jgi:uncharacterized membrane protein YphA (DoxX/SURF4 family)
MNRNPISDVVAFVLQPGWTTAAFWVLVLGSIAIAIYVYRRIPGQRSWEHVANWVFRLLIGCETGLAYWMGVMGKSAAIPLQADFVNNIVLPHFYVFAPIVYAAETLTAISLILGLFVRFWGFIGALQILNLWLGLYNAEGEWPWTYFFLLVLQLIFAVHRYGRSLGLDALIVAQLKTPRTLGGTILAEAT